MTNFILKVINNEHPKCKSVILGGTVVNFTGGAILGVQFSV